jgi:hypothetical protein
VSNCVVGSDGGGTPLGVVTEHIIILRITATMMTLDFLLAAARRLENSLRAGLYRLALRAAM